MVRHLAVAAVAALVVAGCEGANMPIGTGDTVASPATGTAAPAARRPGRPSAGDVEAPEVFSTTDQGLWDGRPSLGGVWVASPTATDPERVLIRNPANGKSVIGALFRRERDNPGPRLQVSSDAAAALSMLAGAPAELTVIALRREDAAPATQPQATQLPASQPKVQSAASGPAGAATAAEPGSAAATQPAPLPTAAANAMQPDKPRPFWRRRDARAVPSAAPAVPVPVAVAAPPVAPPALGGALIQIGIFSVEANARQAVSGLVAAGVPAEVMREQSKGKTYWRVIAGPATSSDRTALMTKIRGLGFKDAFFVPR